MPPNYWTLQRRLLRRGAERVDICQLWQPDWLLAGFLGMGSVMRRTGRAIAATYRAGGRRPIIVIGHSAGGIATRLAMSPAPFHGRKAGVAEAVGGLVTLGTPHGLTGLPNRYRHAGHEAAAFLERETPGAWFAPRTAYLTVGARNVSAKLSGRSGRTYHDVFRVMLGDETELVGDGIVPVAAVHLEGAHQLTYDDVVHGMFGGQWYGDDRVIDRWWPTAVDLWHQALAARAHGEPPIGPSHPDQSPAMESAVESASAGQDLQKSLEFEVAGWSSGSSSGS